MDLLEKVKDAGVIGAGGAGFPTHVKLGIKAEYMLLNAAECEPLLRVDQQLMVSQGQAVLSGFHLAARYIEAKKAIVGIKSKHADIIAHVQRDIEALGLADYIQIGELPDVYPAGDEQVLVNLLTGRVVPELGIPAAVGCVVINVETALNIFNASHDMPVTEKYVTIAGDVPSPTTVKVPVGTPFSALFNLSGRSDLTGYGVIDGGPMMGPLVTDINGFVTRKTKGLIVLSEEHHLIKKKMKTMQSALLMNKTACEQCRMCTDLCPRYLLGHSTSPHKMVRMMAFGLEADESAAIAMTCCQCNLCEFFSCPAGISPRMANTYYMDELRKKEIKYVPKATEFHVRPSRAYRMVPSKRLCARLNLRAFDVAAPLVSDSMAPDQVGISVADFVGAPARVLVKVGDTVARGQRIAEIQDGALGAHVHASIDGSVAAVQGDIVVIGRD